MTSTTYMAHFINNPNFTLGMLESFGKFRSRYGLANLKEASRKRVYWVLTQQRQSDHKTLHVCKLRLGPGGLI